MVAMNLLRGDAVAADYVVTGSWGEKAVEEARKEGELAVVWSGADRRIRPGPGAGGMRGCAADLAALRPSHVERDDPGRGVAGLPAGTGGGSCSSADMSSDFLSRPVDVGRSALIYAGAQKNAGPAGVTTVIVDRADSCRVSPTDCPRCSTTGRSSSGGSMYNTPPVFSIYVEMLVTRWLRDEVGGLEQAARDQPGEGGAPLRRDRRQRRLLPRARRPGSRSLMNVTWRLPERGSRGRRSSTQAAESDMVELQGSPERGRHPREHLQRDAGRRRAHAGRLHARLRRRARLSALSRA